MEGYRKGDWKVLCQHSGFHVWASETVENWDGLRVHRRFADIRNPQDFVRGKRDVQTPPFVSPEPTDTFLEVNDVTRDSF